MLAGIKRFFRAKAARIKLSWRLRYDYDNLMEEVDHAEASSDFWMSQALEAWEEICEAVDREDWYTVADADERYMLAIRRYEDEAVFRP